MLLDLRFIIIIIVIFIIIVIINIVVVVYLSLMCILLLWAAHTPDNTFLGFVVQHQLNSGETELLKSTKRQNQALVYGKNAKFWKVKIGRRCCSW